jgi:low temperature requirement protein LtrA
MRRKIEHTATLSSGVGAEPIDDVRIAERGTTPIELLWDLVFVFASFGPRCSWGESIVAIGVGASGRRLDAELIAGVSLALLITVGLWWTYFDRFAATAEERLRSHEDPVLAASDAYSYLHLVGHVAFRLRMIGSVSRAKIGAATASLVLFALSGDVPAWVTAGALTLV